MRNTILTVLGFTIHEATRVWGIIRLGIHFLNKKRG